MNYKEMRYINKIYSDYYEIFSPFTLLRKPYIFGVPTEKGVKMI